MPTITYTASDFPSGSLPSLTGTHQINVTWHELVWSAVSVGKRGLDDMLAHDIHSIDEILFRAYSIWANLHEINGQIHRSPSYDDLDPTEKGAISYFHGMAIAKLISSRLFQAHWMTHLDRLVDYSAIGLAGRSRPDLAGVDVKGRWIVVESKGRSLGFSNAALQKAKEQVRQVHSIDSVPPYFRVGIQSFFAPNLSAYIIDPEKPTHDSVKLTIGHKRLAKEYYKRFLRVGDLKTREQQIKGRHHSFIDLTSIGVSVGVSDKIEQFIEFGKLHSLETVEYFEQDESKKSDKRITYVAFPDGIAIGLDERWSKSAMERKPADR